MVIKGNVITCVFGLDRLEKFVTHDPSITESFLHVGPYFGEGLSSSAQGLPLSLFQLVE